MDIHEYGNLLTVNTQYLQQKKHLYFFFCLKKQFDLLKHIIAHTDAFMFTYDITYDITYRYFRCSRKAKTL